MLNVILSTVAGLATDWFNNKREEAKTKHEVKLEQIKAEKDWDSIQATNAGSSWKDEWFTVLLSVPLILAFVPDAVPYVQQGFEVLAEMPDFYKAFLGAAVAASFGMKSIATWRK